jgi:hypothetical protein
MRFGKTPLSLSKTNREMVGVKGITLMHRTVHGVWLKGLAADLGSDPPAPENTCPDRTPECSPLGPLPPLTALLVANSLFAKAIVA